MKKIFLVLSGEVPKPGVESGGPNTHMGELKLLANSTTTKINIHMNLQRNDVISSSQGAPFRWTKFTANKFAVAAEDCPSAKYNEFKTLPCSVQTEHKLALLESHLIMFFAILLMKLYRNVRLQALTSLIVRELRN